MRVWFCTHKLRFPLRCSTAAYVHRRRPIGTANGAVAGTWREGQAVCVGGIGQNPTLELSRTFSG